MEMTLSQELRLNKNSNAIKMGIIGLLFVIAYWPALVILEGKFSALGSYYSHGYLIPFVSAFIIWHKKDKLKNMVVIPCRAGLWVVGGGLFLYLFASWWQVNVVAASSMIIVLGGLSLYLFGKKITWELAFPLLFLFFMIPLPKTIIIRVTFWLKMFAAEMATEASTLLGIPAAVRGAWVAFPDGTLLEVDCACSGLRSIIALVALGAAYGYFLRASWFKKGLFLLASLPIATFSNLIRIVILIWIAYVYGPGEAAFRVTDLVTGILVFVFALIGLNIVGSWLTLWENRKNRKLSISSS